MKAKFEINITYFKPSGKFYSIEYHSGEFEHINDIPDVIYMNDVVDWIKQSREQGILPGLKSGKWEGYILVECLQGYPCLILPG